MHAPLPWRFRGGITLGVLVMSIISGAAAEPGTRYREEMMAAIRNGLPKFDAKDPAPAAVEKPSSTKRSASVPPEIETATTSGSSPSPENQKDAIVLPKLMIESSPLKKIAPLSALPRAPPPPTKEAAIDPFTSPAERDKLLVEKHLSAFDRKFLNRFNLFGLSKEERARDAERIEQNANLLNRIADVVEVSRQLGIETEEDRKLRAEYLKLLRTRPR